MGPEWEGRFTAARTTTTIIITITLSGLGLILSDSFGGRGLGVRAQVSWTPIYVDTTNRLDLWTVSSTGCECPDGRSRSGCACCVKPGGCLCSFKTNKCAQCGLEDACQRFCNVSISSRTMATKSGLSWVHLQSPALEGPTSCWWRLESAPGQRIEVQIHRLLSVGRFDNATQKCMGGFLQFSDGDNGANVSPQAIQLCAENSRFSPPIVLFGDQGVATVLLRIDGKTVRSQLAAYVSFSSADDPIVGDPSKGGRLRSQSVCDWTYENCWLHDCVLASPGFPGLFPPNRRCRYFLTANSTTDKIRLRFHALSFPDPPLCLTHHIAIWRRNVSSLANLGPPWKTLCQGTETREVELEGGQALVEFRSGPTTSPYVYNGFRASVQFIHSITPSVITNHHQLQQQQPNNRIPATGRPALAAAAADIPDTSDDVSSSVLDGNGGNIHEEAVEEPMGYPRASYEVGSMYPVSCGHVFEGDQTRGNVFRLIIPRDLTLPPPPHHPPRQGAIGLRGFGTFGPEPKTPPPQPLPGLFKCQLEFRGKLSDVVQLAVFNYKFRGANCSTVMEVYDMEEDPRNYTDRLLGKLCGPSGNEVKRFTSSHNKMALVTIVFPHQDPLGAEFLEGAFRFHDETLEGTVKPMSNCEVVYYGVTSAPMGRLLGPPDSPLLRLSTFPLVCANTFLPATNQSISLTFDRAGHDTANVALPGSRKYCRTFCASSGCRCESKYTPLDQIDHLSLVIGSTPIGCLCGFFPDILPITFESHAPLMLVYHATKGGHEFSYSAKFHFQNKVTCGNFTVGPAKRSGTIRWREILGPAISSLRSSQHYTYFQCIWPVNIPHRYKLTIDFVSEENEEDCRTWNLTLWANSQKILERDRSEILSSFCPKHGKREIKIPDTVQNAYIRLTGVALRPPQFEIRWRYVDAFFGTGLVTEKKVSSSSLPPFYTSFHQKFLIAVVSMGVFSFQYFCIITIT